MSVSDGKAACERRKQKSSRRASVGNRRVLAGPFGELVVFMPIEKSTDTGETRNRVCIMLGLVDRFDEVVIGTPERVVGQRGDARQAKSVS